MAALSAKGSYVLDSDIHTIKIYQQEYFDALREFFIDAVGTTPNNFCIPSEFSRAINGLGDKFKDNPSCSEKLIKAFATLEKRLSVLYSDESAECFKSAKNIECCKVNLGGSSRFLETQLKCH